MQLLHSDKLNVEILVELLFYFYCEIIEVGDGRERERERERKAYYDPLSKSDISPSGLLQSSVHTQTSSSALQDQTELLFSGR